MSVAERRKGGPSGTRAQSAVMRAEIIRHRLAGKTLESVAQLVDLTKEGVRYHEQAWLAEQTPTAEVTEERRQKQLASIDQVRDRLFSALDDREDDLAAQLAVVDRIEKLWNREARLVGLDLTTQSVTINVTAEGLAAALGFDDSVIDVEAASMEEITDGT